MSDMNTLLQGYYGTGTQAQDTNTAQLEFFSKVASANGIDLATLDDSTINYLWNETFNKTADDAAAVEALEEAQEAIEEAKEEFLEQKESMAKIAFHDYLGRVQAHGFMDELSKLGGENLSDAEKATRKQNRRRIALHSVGGALLGAGTGVGIQSGESNKRKAISGGIGAAAGAATGAWRGYRVNKKLEKQRQNSSEQTKESSFDVLAAQVALQKVAQAGYNADEAVDRLNAVLTLGVGESMKIASAQSFEHGVEIRALELTEAAGYPVNWA